jgi:glycosyltransferase involved in cell wall biosynthesis
VSAGIEHAMKKTIMIDGFNLSLEKGTGVSTYARNLSYCLEQLGYGVDILYGKAISTKSSDLIKEIRFYDETRKHLPEWMRVIRSVNELAGLIQGYQAHKIPITGKVIDTTFKGRQPYFDSIHNAVDIFRKSHNNFGFCKKIQTVHLENTPALMHWTYPLPLKAAKAPNIYTLHDLVPLRLPYTTLDKKPTYLQLVKKIANTADHIVTVSEASKQDIVDILGVSPDRISNTYQSVNIPEKYANKSPEVVEREICGAFNLEYKKYFIFWGAIEPKKNVGRLIEAYLASGVKDPLILVGSKAWKSDQELRLMSEDYIASTVKRGKKSNIKKKIYLLDYVPFSMLISLIKGAKATIFPSIYEGFGLPVLESMLLGTPVITSNNSSIPEVAGDAAILVNPYDTAELAEAIRRVDADEDLRNHLSQQGLKQAALFSQENYCKRLNDVYKKFL